MKPINVNLKPRAMKGKRILVRPDAKARIRSIPAPETLGTTVFRFVMTAS
jgi:hypothetical protein